MKITHSVASVAALSFTLFAAGCAVQASDNAASSSAAAISSSEKLVGTWGQTGGDNLAFYSFTFKSDHEYTAQGGCRPNPNGPSCFAITGSQGTWKLAKSGPQLGAPAGADEIVLDDQFGQETTYFYSVDDSTLSLSTIWMGDTSTFTKGSANAPPATQNACQAAGGSCVALSPGSCANGTVVDANTFSCGGGLGVECCMPGAGDDAGADAGADQADAGQDASAASCQVDSDCQGFLPQTCEVCSDGSTACAAWSCQAGQCAITYCNN
jgi:hypothetical protein